MKATKRAEKVELRNRKVVDLGRHRAAGMCRMRGGTRDTISAGEARAEHVRANLELLGRLYSRHIEEHPESVREYPSVRSGGCRGRGIRTTVENYPSSIMRKAVQAMSVISDRVDAMKAKCVEYAAPSAQYEGRTRRDWVNARRREYTAPVAQYEGRTRVQR